MHAQRWLSRLYPAWRGKGHLVRDGHTSKNGTKVLERVRFYARARNSSTVIPLERIRLRNVPLATSR